ncbi:hypothetical protein PATSB16_20110 [Pandoraea thiooxydans]|nr:hypothetical protein PATSB16_20110 [Pandoraea thiooxydans]
MSWHVPRMARAKHRLSAIGSVAAVPQWRARRHVDAIV